MKAFSIAVVSGLLSLAPIAAQAAMTVALEAPWDGKRIPGGQQCQPQGGKGATPPMQISKLPKGTVTVLLSFNDLDYPPLSRNGGHGQIAFGVRGAQARLPAVPGMTNRLPAGAKVVAAARSDGSLATNGYLPPCSNRNNHRYVVDVSAVGSDGKILETVTVQLGRY